MFCSLNKTGGFPLNRGTGGLPPEDDKAHSTGRDLPLHFW